MAVAAYQLKSELARFCLPAPERDSYRRLAWVNSLCLMFLLIGVFGAQNKLPVPKHAAPLEQPVPVVIEPLPATPPPTESKTAERQDEDQKPKAQSIVAVTLNSPAINFSVPTIGNLIVPVSAAPAPPGESMAPTAPAPQAPLTIGSTGKGGDRPEPPYPPMALQMQKQGTVVLLFTVDDVGAVVSASIKESSGSPLLDQSALDCVKRRWIQPPINGGHLFQVSISFKLQID